VGGGTHTAALAIGGTAARIATGARSSGRLRTPAEEGVYRLALLIVAGIGIRLGRRMDGSGSETPEGSAADTFRGCYWATPSDRDALTCTFVESRFVESRFVKTRFGRGDERTRTADPLLAKQVLYQLSYVPELPKETLPEQLLQHPPGFAPQNLDLMAKDKDLDLTIALVPSPLTHPQNPSYIRA
jgi:hypothetical protein